jgi:hypothetical protein
MVKPQLKQNTTMAKAFITDILWDTETKAELKILPKKVELELPEMDEEDIADYISDELSDTYGYCHNGFAYEIENN